MRYYADGDLTEGLQISAKPYPVEMIEGDWHIVWACIDGICQTINYDEPGNLSLMGLTLQMVEPSDKRKKQTDAHLQLNLNFCQWGLEYAGSYSAVGPATKLELTVNTTPALVDADDEAVLVFGIVPDDEGYPFLRLGTSASPISAGLDHLQNLEFVAKKTDTTGIHCLELTKNEKLRLGYAVREDGTFAEQGLGGEVLGETAEALTRQLREHTDAQTRIFEKLATIRAQIDKQLRDLPRPGQRGVPKLQERVPKSQERQRGNGSASKPPPPAPQHAEPLAPEDELIAAAGGPRLERDSSPSPSRASTPSSRTSSWNFGAGAEGGVKKKKCRVCEKAISAANWAVHEKSRKHQVNLQEAMNGDGEDTSAKRQRVGRLSRGERRETGTGMLLRGGGPDTPSSM